MAVALRCVREWSEAIADQAHPAEAALSAVVLVEVLSAVVLIAVAIAVAVPSVVVHAAVPSAVVHAAVPSAVARTAALVAEVPSAVAHTVVHMVAVTAVDTAVEVAEWADADKSEHQLPDFRIRHFRNLAH